MADEQKIRALVVDDSPQIREFVTEYILKPHGFLIDIAVDGSEGLQKALETRPDLILLDYELPSLTGIEVLRILRQSNSKIPVILMTSHGSEQVAVEVFRLGVHDYIMKPFTVEEMLEAIENALSVTRLQRERDALVRRVFQANQQLEERLQEFNVLYRIGKSITALMDPEKMLERIVDAVMYMIKGDEGVLVLIDPDTGRSKKHVKRRRPTGNQNGGQQQRRQHTTGLLMSAAVEDKGVVNIGTENLLSVPLQVGQKVVGTLSVTKHLETFTDHDEQLLRMLADYAAIAVHNLQLMRQLQRRKEQEKQHIRELFERYVPPSVVEQMLTQPDHVELGGKRETVSILFADVRGFSSFSSQTSPEILIELLNQYMRVAADAVLAQKGTLDKFMGDAVMAFFNAPLPQPDHALRAVRTAWTLQRKVELLHQYLPPQHRLQFGVGVGVGEVVVGNIGTHQLMNFTVIGDTVNKAKRLQENARGGQILISQETYFLLQHQIQAQRIGEIQLKGQSRPEPVYEVLGIHGS